MFWDYWEFLLAILGVIGVPFWRPWGVQRVDVESLGFTEEGWEEVSIELSRGTCDYDLMCAWARAVGQGMAPTAVLAPRSYGLVGRFGDGGSCEDIGHTILHNLRNAWSCGSITHND